MSIGKILVRDRIRQTHNGFGFIPHRFLREGFLSSLSSTESYLYLFYVLAADRYGVSFYSDRRIGDLLGLTAPQLRHTRDSLIHQNLICCEDPVCQVLELPRQPVLLPVETAARARSFTDLKDRIGR